MFLNQYILILRYIENAPLMLIEFYWFDRTHDMKSISVGLLS